MSKTLGNRTTKECERIWLPLIQELLGNERGIVITLQALCFFNLDHSQVFLILIS